MQTNGLSLEQIKQGILTKKWFVRALEQLSDDDRFTLLGSYPNTVEMMKAYAYFVRTLAAGEEFTASARFRVEAIVKVKYQFGGEVNSSTFISLTEFAKYTRAADHAEQAAINEIVEAYIIDEEIAEGAYYC